MQNESEEICVSASEDNPLDQTVFQFKDSKCLDQTFQYSLPYQPFCFYSRENFKFDLESLRCENFVTSYKTRCAFSVKMIDSVCFF